MKNRRIVTFPPPSTHHLRNEEFEKRKTSCFPSHGHGISLQPLSLTQTTTRICPSAARWRETPLRYGYRHRGGAPQQAPIQVTPSCIPQFATMKRNWWPNAGPIVERIRRGDIAQVTCGTEPLMMGGRG